MVAVMWMQIKLFAKCCCFSLGTNTQCIERSLLLYSMHKQMFVITFYVLRTRWWLTFSASSLSPTPSYQHFSLPDIHVQCRSLSSAGSTHFPEHSHGTDNRNSHTPVFCTWWWCPRYLHTHSIRACSWVGVSFLGISVLEKRYITII